MRHLLLDADVVNALRHIPQLESQIAKTYGLLGVTFLGVHGPKELSQLGIIAITCQREVSTSPFS